jgi:PAS domain S-box-containing protein
LSGAKFGAFFYNVVNDGDERYVLYTISGVPRAAFEKFPLPRNTAIFDPTFRGVGIVRSDDIRRDPRYGHNNPHRGMPRGHLPVVSYLAVPVVSRSGEVLGGLFFGHDLPGVFTQEAEDIVAGIAAHAAIAIDNANLLRTAQRTAELRNTAERHLAAIVESSDDAIVSKDLDGIIISWNKSAEQLFGYTADEIVGKSILTLIPPHLQHEEPGILSRIRAGDRIDHYETVRQRKDGTLFDVSLTVSPVRDQNGRIVAASKIARDISESKRIAAQRDLLIAELNHRVKNTLATVVAISHQSFVKGRSSEESHRSFERRLRALAQTHGRLAEANWAGVSLEMLVADETAPYRDERGDVRLAGPHIQLNPKSAVSLGMAFHELTTNAAKYGALSTKHGNLEVTWSIATDRELRIRWQESGGPEVQAPERSGFGRLLLERALGSDLDAEVQLKFAPAGLECIITFPLDRFDPLRDSQPPALK